MKKKLLIITLCLTIPAAQAMYYATTESQTADQEFGSKAIKTVLAGFCINGIAALTRDNYIPATALFPAAAIIGAGSTLLWKLDKRDLAKNPHCGAARRKSPVLKSLVVAAGLLPIIFSESQAGEHLRALLSPVYEAAWQLGESAVSTALGRF